jgi:SDR family mycofactocin-dependent oxidoreductase
MPDLDGRVALVTGAARGQGRADAIALAGAGAEIIAIDICKDADGITYPLGTAGELAETAAAVRATGRRAMTFEVDVRDRERLRTVLGRAVQELHRLDIVVANAGLGVATTWDKVTVQQWEATVGTCLTGTWNTLQAASGHIIAGGRGGSMIVLGSTGAFKGLPGLSAYVAAKHGVVGLARAYAYELAEHSIRVNIVHPTSVNTPFGGYDEPKETRSSLRAVHDLAQASPKYGACYTNLLPVDHIEASDIADAVLFLASDASKWITGLSLNVDAGNSLV